ncbi:MAG: hypothetical protein DRR06_16035 [Gammaproteobacteria bacterium]|nr:MAG: hypothetical protein DRR06_16035 [Gammaproteobacteria bacterium]
MKGTVFSTIGYEDQDRQVSWCGVSMEDGDGLRTFMTNDVASRLYDKEGAADFEVHLRSLANTGFARESLDAVLMAEIPEGRDWAVGEAMAEAHLTREHGVSWPWNMERDKRNPKASLPGADLVGFKTDGADVRLVLGEVKTSTDERTPPGVMSGRGGMTHQIDNLATNLSLIFQLLKWLLPRCKGTEHETSFNTAIGLFLESGNKAVALFGVLIRDTKFNKKDLQARGRALAGSLQDPTTCHLIAIYLPCAIADLPARVSGGGS